MLDGLKIDGVEMEIEDDEQIFLLPDGSLFFLASKIGDTALYTGCPTKHDPLCFL